MPTSIISFGFNKPIMVDGSPVFEFENRKSRLYRGSNLILDVRGWLPRNPYHNKKLRQLRGTDLVVQAEIQKTPGFQDSLLEILEVVKNHHGIVWIGCTGGHHRSVFITELLGKTLGVPVKHLHINV